MTQLRFDNIHVCLYNKRIGSIPMEIEIFRILLSEIIEAFIFEI